MGLQIILEQMDKASVQTIVGSREYVFSYVTIFCEKEIYFRWILKKKIEF